MAEPRHVLWIMADQHNAKCTGWGAFPEPVRTPNLERLAATGTRFDRAFSQNPLCTPARTTFVTGQYPTNHGHYGLTGYGVEETRSPSPTTVFGLAADAGYRTGVFGKVHTPPGLIEPDVCVLRDVYGHNAPAHYESYLDAKSRRGDRDDDQLPEWREVAGPDGGQGIDARPTRLDYEDTPEHWAMRRARQFIGESDGPTFTWLSFPRPHQVYAPPDRFWARYPDPDELTLPPSADEDLSDKPAHQRETRARHATGDLAVFEPRTYDALRRRKLKGYLGCVTMVDDLVGRMLDFLEREGLREETLVVYCSDHGEFAVEHGLLEKAPGVSYDAVSRIPLVWSWPGTVEQGAACDDLVEAVDFLPTVAELLGRSRPASADGRSLAGSLSGGQPDAERRYAASENPWAKSVRTDRYRLTIYPRGFFGEGSDERYELYDLEADPWETENLAADPAREPVVRELSRHLYDFAVVNRRPGSTHPPLDADESADGTVDPRNIARHLRDGGGSNYL